MSDRSYYSLTCDCNRTVRIEYPKTEATCECGRTLVVAPARLRAVSPKDIRKLMVGAKGVNFARWANYCNQMDIEPEVAVQMIHREMKRMP